MPCWSPCCVAPRTSSSIDEQHRCSSVRAKRGGDLVGPNPTDRGKRGTKYHLAVTGDGVPVACAATGANVNDTVLFERLFLTAFAVTARIAIVFADKGYV